MAAPPYMPLYVADYLGDTRHLTTEQHGAYLLLLMALWRAGGRLPADEAKLARLTGMTPRRWAKAAEEVGAFFTVEDGELTHPRLVEELARYERFCSQRRAAGSRGGTAKAKKAISGEAASATPPLAPRSGETAGESEAGLQQPKPKPEPEPELEPKPEGEGCAGTALRLEDWDRDRLDALQADLRAVAGASLDAASPNLVNLAPIVAVLTPGQGPPADLQADVLPAIRARAARQKPGSVRHWAYFVPAVLEWRDQRLAGAPRTEDPESLDDRPRSSPVAGRASRAEKRAVWAEVLADEAGA